MSLPEPSEVVSDPEAWGAVVAAYAELQRRRAVLDAQEVRLLAEAAAVAHTAEQAYRGRRHGDRSIPLRSLVADLAVTARLSEWSVKRALADAADLCDRFPAAVDALAEGRVSRRHVAVIHDAGGHLVDDDVRARFEALALERAYETTPGRLGPVVEAIAARLDPVGIDTRHRAALKRRGVWVREKGDAMGELVLAAPIVLVRAGLDRLTQFADEIVAARQPDDAQQSDAEAGCAPDEDAEADLRTMDQLRADVLTDLLLTGTPATCTSGDGLDAVRGIVQVTVPVLTAAGVGDEPSLLAGAGPIDSNTARRLLGVATGWERVLTSPVTGAVLAVDRYTPGKALTRLLRARDERCRFPGCRRAVWRCDLDHSVDHALGGPTCVCNLAHLCKGHHIIKHHGAWTVQQLGGGALAWTSPSGRRSTDRPEPVVRFVADRDPGAPPPSDAAAKAPPGTAAQWLSDPDALLALCHDRLVAGTTPF